MKLGLTRHLGIPVTELMLLRVADSLRGAARIWKGKCDSVDIAANL